MKSSTSCQEPVEYKEEPAMYKGIARIKRAGKLWWQAQDTTNKQYIGIADTVAGATALLESHHGEAPAQRARNQWYSRDRQVEHFKELSDIYTDQHGNAILPSDVGASIDMELQYPDLASEAPALFYIATMAKHGPFKKTVGLRWAEVCCGVRGHETNEVPEACELQEVYVVLEVLEGCTAVARR
jgi:hypothetical protein